MMEANLSMLHSVLPFIPRQKTVTVHIQNAGFMLVVCFSRCYRLRLATSSSLSPIIDFRAKTLSAGPT